MNLAETLRYSAERTPHLEAVAGEGVSISYRELADRASAIAAGMKSLGVDQGDVVATVMRNTARHVEVFWACQWLGAIYMPLSWRNPPATVRYSVEDALAKLVVYEEAGAEHVEGLASDVTLVAATRGGGARSLGDLSSIGSLEGNFGMRDSEPALMLYTSGTTGVPKGVSRSHRVERSAATAQALQHGYVRSERTLGVMPLYHTMGVHSLLSVALLGGCYVVQPEWNASQAVSLVKRYGVTSLYLAPTLFYDLVNSGASSLPVRALGYAGAAMTGVLVESCASFFTPQVFVNHYGSTEIYCYTIGGGQRTKPGNAGPASINSRIRVVSMDGDADADDVVGVGEQGQIICHMSSDEAFSGYWKRPDADEKAIRDGWYFTGDLGRVDEDGDHWILGRVDDMFISGGVIILPLEVESVLVRAPGVREVAVFATPDDRYGQKVTAAIVADDSVDAETLDAFCLGSGDLARYKRPREYRFVTELPRSASGKILRRLLREGD